MKRSKITRSKGINIMEFDTLAVAALIGGVIIGAAGAFGWSKFSIKSHHDPFLLGQIARTAVQAAEQLGLDNPAKLAQAVEWLVTSAAAYGIKIDTKTATMFIESAVWAFKNVSKSDE
jgi:hypothetical protein